MISFNPGNCIEIIRVSQNPHQIWASVAVLAIEAFLIFGLLWSVKKHLPAIFSGMKDLPKELIDVVGKNVSVEVRGPVIVNVLITVLIFIVAIISLFLSENEYFIGCAFLFIATWIICGMLYGCWLRVMNLVDRLFD